MKNNNNKKLTVTVGISAYNEESNIESLIKSILSQSSRNYRLEKLIIISDKSTDQTDSIVKKMRHQKIVFRRNQRQLGKALTQNIITGMSNSDVLVIFDADVLPKSKRVIELLVAPFYKNPVIGLVGGHPVPLTSKSFVERIINSSVLLKEQLYVQIRGANNIFLCHGRVRAFRKEFYKSFHWQRVAGEDAFSYLMCISKGWEFTYVHNAIVNYRSPNTLSDHLRQSTRFLKGNTRMKKYFPGHLVAQEYHKPAMLGIWFLLKNVFRNPVEYSAYTLIYLYAKILAFSTEDQPGTWKISNTTKTLA